MLFRCWRKDKRCIFRCDDRALDHVLQFPHVPRPRLAFQRVEHLVRNLPNLFAMALGKSPNKVRDQKRNVFGPMSKRWDDDRKER
jgi:hypothetical protein